MSNRADDIRRRHEERKRKRQSADSPGRNPGYYKGSEGNQGNGVPAFRGTSDHHSSDEGHPLARKESILFRVMIAAILFLGVGIMFKNPSPAFDQARTFVKKTFHHEFQFALVSDWYQKQFGSAVALFPKSNDTNMKAGKETGPNYSVPVSGTVVTENFKDTGQKGIMLETSSEKAAVRAVKRGFVTYIGKKKGIGKTVVIQLPDGTSEAWYGDLAAVNVQLYDYVERGEKIGKVTPSKDGDSGIFFFAMKKNNAFINPLKVIPFE
ncbi:MAG TPA: M23 family metallopeptidase [Bacillales bacterium]|nr:M23 family metallopeptidase [Bacillales bacterium]